MRRKGTLTITLGLLLILAAAVLAGYNLWDDRQAGLTASQDLIQLVRQSEQAQETDPEREGETLPSFTRPDYELVPEMEMPVEESQSEAAVEDAALPVVEIDGREYVGTLYLPTIGRTLPVLNGWSGELLKIAPCRYMGSAYNDNLIVMAHNYDSHFGRLKKLQIGDPVTFRDVEDNDFEYEVVSLEILNPEDVEPMEEGDWDLTLFTCTIGGKTRITVRCARMSTDNFINN